MGTKLSYVCEFEDIGPSRISYEVSGPPGEQAVTTVEEQTPVLYVNKGACRVLAEIFAKLAVGSYKPGFHVHLHENFDSERKEMLRVVLAFANDQAASK